jgi:hypothetical protein
MAAAKPPRRAKSSAAQALPWIFAGVGILCVGLAGYELAQISAAERASETEKNADMFAALHQEGRHAETMFWVFSGAGTLALSSALVLALVGDAD